MACVAQPQIIGQVSVHLRREETHFGEQMTGALAPVGQLLFQSLVKQDDRFGTERAILGCTE